MVTLSCQLRLHCKTAQFMFVTFAVIFFTLYTVKKAERDAGPKHEGDGKFRHPHRRILSTF
jgi:hypothetical protein